MIYWPYVLPMIVVCSLTYLKGNEQMIRTAMVIALNWAILTLYVLLTADNGGWWLYLPIDALSAFAILYPPAGRAQALIGWTYMAQIIMHVVFATSNPLIADYAYWQILTWIAWVQLILLGGWVSGRWFGLVDRGDDPHPAGADGVSRMARG
jgi:hypothetical protein